MLTSGEVGEKRGILLTLVKLKRYALEAIPTA